MKATISVFVLCIVSVIMAQRSPYAPRPVGYPQVLDRFNANAGDETIDANGIPNRIGGTEDKGPLQPEAGAMGDPYLLPHIPQWSPEHQPFWYLNQQKIKDHLNQGQRPASSGTGTQTGQTTGNRVQNGQTTGTRVQNGQTTGNRVQNGQTSGTGLNTRLGGEQAPTSNVLGSQRVQSSFISRPVHRPDELHRPANSQ